MNGSEVKVPTMGRVGQVFTVLGLIAMAAVFVRALVFTPTEATQGLAQKIFYIHAPAAIGSLMAFSITGLASIFYLWLKDARVDLFAESSAEVGLALSVVMLTTGPIWGKPIWGTWWSWDARLTSTLFIFLLFIGYKVMRGAISDPVVRGQYSAVIGIMGLLLVPFIHLTVYLFRTLHPNPVIMKPSAPSMPGVMLVTFAMGVGAYLILYLGFVMQRYSIGVMREARLEDSSDA